MFTKRQTRNILVGLSALFALSLLLVISQVYIENFPSILGSNTFKPVQNQLPDTRSHTVKIGETLSDISKKYYGSPHYIQTLAEANDIELNALFVLEPGTKLNIPYTP